MKLFEDFISFIIEQFKFTNCSFESVNWPCYAVFTIKRKKELYLNLLSLLLSIACLVFAFHSVQVKGCLICSTLSGACCSTALLCQLMDNDRLARIEDVTAILDTAHGRVVCSAVLLGLCTALNLLALLRSRKQNSCKNC